MLKWLKRLFSGSKESSEVAGAIPPAAATAPQPVPTTEGQAQKAAHSIIRNLAGSSRGLASGTPLSCCMDGTQAAIPTEQLARHLEGLADKYGIKITSVYGYEVNAIKL